MEEIKTGTIGEEATIATEASIAMIVTAEIGTIAIVETEEIATAETNVETIVNDAIEMIVTAETAEVATVIEAATTERTTEKVGMSLVAGKTRQPIEEIS